jgi:hypothetical protein
MKTLYESLLDDEEEVLDRTNLNIFSDLYASKTKKEFYKQVDILFDLCTKVNSAEEMQKHKNAFFVTELFHAFSGAPSGIVIDKAAHKNKKSVVFSIYESVNKTCMYISKFGKIKFGQGHRVSGYDQHEDVYMMPEGIAKQFVEYLKTHEDFIQAENYGMQYKNKIGKIV